MSQCRNALNSFGIFVYYPRHCGTFYQPAKEVVPTGVDAICKRVCEAIRNGDANALTNALNEADKFIVQKSLSVRLLLRKLACMDADLVHACARIDTILSEHHQNHAYNMRALPSVMISQFGLEIVKRQPPRPSQSGA
jgi:hypothetical protein